MRVLPLSALLIAALSAQAEVLDKEWSLGALSAVVLTSSVSVFIAARYRPWLLALIIPIVGAVFYGQLAELLDPAIGPALSREAGAIYPILSWSGPCLAVLAVVLGLVARNRAGSQ